MEKEVRTAREQTGGYRRLVASKSVPVAAACLLGAWLLLAGLPAGLLALAASSVAGVVGYVDESTGRRRSVLGA
jgi:hypothetical protein